MLFKAVGRFSLIIFSVVFVITLALSGWYFIASGKSMKALGDIYNNKITFSSQNPDIKIKLADRQKLESYLLKYDVLGTGKELSLVDSVVHNANVNRIQITLVPEDTGFGQVYSTGNAYQLAFSYYPEYSNSLLKINLYLDSSWLKNLSEKEVNAIFFDAIFESLYLTTHKVDTSTASSVNAQRSSIYNEALSNSSNLFRFSWQ